MEPSSATKTIGIVLGWGGEGRFVSLVVTMGTKGTVGISLLAAIYVQRPCGGPGRQRCPLRGAAKAGVH